MFPDLGDVKRVFVMVLCLLLGHDLHVHLPAGILAAFDCLVEIPAMTLAIVGNDRGSFRIGDIFDPLLGFEMELTPDAFVLRIVETEGVLTKRVHMAVACQNTQVRHDNRHLMETYSGSSVQKSQLFWADRRFVFGSRFTARLRSGKLCTSRMKKRRRVVADEIPVTLFGVELAGESADVPFRISRSPFSGNGGEPDEEIGLCTGSKHFCPRVA